MQITVKLGENYFNFQTGSPCNFPGIRKSPSDYRRDQRRRKHHGKGMPTSGNHGVGSVAPGDPTVAQKGIILQLHPPLLAIERYHGQSIYSLHQINPSWTELEVLALRKTIYPKASTPTVAPLVQHECQSSHFTPFFPDRFIQPDPLPTTACLLTTHINPP